MGHRQPYLHTVFLHLRVQPAIAALLVMTAAASGQGPGMTPPADFERFFEQMLGGQSDVERQRLAQIKVSPAEERRFGMQAAKAYLDSLRAKRIRITSRGADVRYLRSLVATLHPLMRHANRYNSIQIYLAESPETDARSFPGGTLVIFRGMLDFAESEAALVGVLAHELSHLDHGHQLRQIKSMRLAQQTFSSGAKGRNVQEMMENGMFLAGLFARPMRPEEEAEADGDAATWTYGAGYDPRELARLFLRMHQRGGGLPGFVPAFFRSHPQHQDRYKAVMKRYGELQAANPRDDLYVGRVNLQRKIPRDKRRFDR